MPPHKAIRRKTMDAPPDERDEAPAIVPDDQRRTDQPDDPPDSPPQRKGPGITDTRSDGGVAEHPIHDEDLDDMEPEDYEQQITGVMNGVEPLSEESTEIDDAADEFDVEELGPRLIPSKDRDHGPGR